MSKIANLRFVKLPKGRLRVITKFRDGREVERVVLTFRKEQIEREQDPAAPPTEGAPEGAPETADSSGPSPKSRKEPLAS